MQAIIQTMCYPTSSVLRRTTLYIAPKAESYSLLAPGEQMVSPGMLNDYALYVPSADDALQMHVTCISTWVNSAARHPQPRFGLWNF